MTLFTQLVLPLYEQHRADWLATARAEARRLGQGGTIITIDDVREKCPPPKEVDGRVMGAVFTRKDWENLGYTKGNRAESHARPIATFRLKNHGGVA